MTPVHHLSYAMQCGSCWAFAAVSTIESAFASVTGTLLKLSEQQALDCTYTARNGCDGGWPTDAFQTIIQSGGILQSANYPYKGSASTCRFDAGVVSVQLSSFTDVPSGSEDELMKVSGCLPVRLPACLHACMPACLHACMPACLHA
jgi:hypothetical protein